MKNVLYFCSYDGSEREVFKSEKKARGWQLDNGSLAFVDEVTFNKENKILTVNGQNFDDFIESISDEIGTEEFLETKNYLEKRWAFTTLLSD